MYVYGACLFHVCCSDCGKFVVQRPLFKIVF